MHCPPSPEPDTAPALIVLPTNLGTGAAEELQTRLVLTLDQSDELTVDASQVETVGQSALQLLVAARRTAVAQGGFVTFINPSPALRARVESCQLTAALGLESFEEFPS